MLSKFFDGSLRHLSTLFLVVLALLVLIAPPISLLGRLNLDFLPNLAGNAVEIAAGEGGLVTDETGAAVIFLPEDASQSGRFELSHIPQEDLANLRAADREWQNSVSSLASAGLTPSSALYVLEADAAVANQRVTIRVPLPSDASERAIMKLVTWRDDQWETLPSTLISSEILMETTLDAVPGNVLLAKDSATNLPSVLVLLRRDQIPAPSESEGVADNIGVLYSQLRGDGGLEGEIPQLDTLGTGTPLWLGVRNTGSDGALRADLLINMLVTEGQAQNQMTALREAMQTQSFQGILLDYRGLDLQPGVGSRFTDFAARLKTELATAGQLAIRVDAPRQTSSNGWDTRGYDWAALGRIADLVIVPTPIDPEAYRRGDFPFESLLQFATSRIERHKLAVELQASTVAAVAGMPNEYRLLPFSQTLDVMLGDLELVAEDNTFLLMRMNRDYMQPGLVYDPNLYQYRFGYTDSAQGDLEVHVSDAANLRYRLGTLQRHNIANVVLDMTAHTDIDAEIWSALTDFKGGNMGELLPPAYKVDYEISQETAAKAFMSVDFEATDERYPLEDTGTFSVQAKVSIDGAKQRAGTQRELTVGAQTPAPPPATVPASTEPLLVPGPGSNLVAHSRPGRNEPRASTLILGQEYEIVGRNNDQTWIQIESDRGIEGWVAFIDAVNFIQNRQRVAGLPVRRVDPPAPPAAAAGTATGTPSHLWGYGIQAHLFGTDAGRAMLMTKQMGFEWVKQQIRWQNREPQKGNLQLGEVDSIVAEADKQGISLLFSVVTAPSWAREEGFDSHHPGPPADPADYANFVSELARRYCGRVKAIEVWNEQNLNHEWGNLPLDPSHYMRLLKAASAAIQSACPSMLIISGALTPAGDTPTAVDDIKYLKLMLQQGLLNYVDAVGAHPSGYNVPPDAGLSNYCSIIAQTGMANFGSGCESNNPHHSFSFRTTMESYRTAVAQYDASKPIWPTEFGWAVSSKPYPGYGYAQDNDYDEQARWTVQAYQMMKDWGWVAAPILWNLNYRIAGANTEREPWGIINTDWSPLPAYNALKNIPK